MNDVEIESKYTFGHQPTHFFLQYYMDSDILVTVTFQRKQYFEQQNDSMALYNKMWFIIHRVSQRTK